MRRTNIYLDDRQLALLQRLGQQRGAPVAGLVREAVDEWLERRGARAVPEDEWQARFGALLQRRAAVAERLRPEADRVNEDVAAAVSEVRSSRARGR